jgi:hypothetical protein
MKITTLAIAAALAAFPMGGVAFADDAAPAKPAPTPLKPPSAKSVECYKQADARQLHGTARKKFHAECLKTK